MLTSLICGSFHERDPEDDRPWSGVNSLRSTRKLGAKNRSFGRRCLSDSASRGKNPYSSVGLDKFSSLLSDVEEKKKNIYLQKDSQDIMFVRFVYSGSEEVVPIVVKSKGRKQEERVVGQREDGLGSGNGANKQAADGVEQVAAAKDEKIETGQKTGKARDIGLRKPGRPCYYIPIFAGPYPTPAGHLRKVIRDPLYVDGLVLDSHAHSYDWCKRIIRWEHEEDYGGSQKKNFSKDCIGQSKRDRLENLGRSGQDDQVSSRV
ncbi:hypothetical protein MLD38_002041 [Melastoma candidum]|uniref:Uncharacterized protein n=1 Tax=Melastoma candidum TaxID=119954 RepID=A0ACB9SGG8_9MYRT|nr:hypothetical protein MLD38_002041 [Melastoma candidum]